MSRIGPTHAATECEAAAGPESAPDVTRPTSPAGSRAKCLRDRTRWMHAWSSIGTTVTQAPKKPPESEDKPSKRSADACRPTQQTPLAS
ncbi:hypothetical protein Sp245p_23795 (plasmid) [Azospirillum baldaniorum]|uniref:Uncharacterized protein n=1 Tax=Azospirillum baldaniorum TaxID=1064539 RepID=A0A9P1NR34_9PROT|nr:hypothetical protein Sp245p_23795 [Azospirillum baldaniorum]CCD02577.1 protein of unknown function [Azospirillum baldaniorum]